MFFTLKAIITQWFFERIKIAAIQVGLLSTDSDF